ncbi:MAG: M48 family metallopeptidase [Sphaerotilus sulfidivorans]|uniref:M48 family metallopeptidase n=1 Tax=Sphaerotilus sulfidivorans TaxID=639200 RepID=UPI003F3E725B
MSTGLDASGPQVLRIRYGDEVISVEVRQQPGRSQERLSIHVEPDGRVLVDAPLGVEVGRLLDSVKRRARWISQQLEGFRIQRSHASPHEYVSGESMLYLGRRYRLKVQIDPTAKPVARMHGAFIEVTLPERDPAMVAAALMSWYRQRAREVFSQRLPVVAEPLRWVRELPSIRLQFMKLQWGSCSPSGRITLNPWLVRAPREAIDYVLLHEMCHLRHHNHSRAFYASLSRHMPDWKQIKTRLDSRAEEFLRIEVDRVG